MARAAPDHTGPETRRRPPAWGLHRAAAAVRFLRVAFSLRGEEKMFIPVLAGSQ